MLGMILLVALALFVAVIAVRTIRFTPKPQPAVSEETFELDENSIVDALAKLVRCKTISYNDKSLEEDAEFEKLISPFAKSGHCYNFPVLCDKNTIDKTVF